MGFLIIIFLSRELGPEKFGLYALFISIYDFLRQFADFGISTSYVKLATEKINQNKPLRDLLYTTLISKFLLCLLLIFPVYLASNQISLFFFSNVEYSTLISLIAVSIIFAQIANVFIIHLQAIQKFKLYSVSNILNQFIRLCTILVIALYFSYDNLDYYIYAHIASFLFLCSLGLILRFRKVLSIFKGSFSLSDLKEIYAMGFWIFLSGIAVVLVMRLDVWMLSKISTELEVGYYSAAIQLAMVFPLITASIQNTLLPKVGDYLKAYSIESYIKKIFKYVPFLILICFLLIVISPFLIKIFFSNQYVNSIPCFRIVLIAVSVSVFINPISLVFYHLKKAHYLTLLNWIQLGINFGLNLLLIPKFGAIGATVSTLCCGLAGLFFVLFFVKKFQYAKKN